MLAQEQLDPLKKDVTQINEFLAKQIFIVNMLFDPQKAGGEFGEKLRGNAPEFATYVEGHVN